MAWLIGDGAWPQHMQMVSFVTPTRAEINRFKTKLKRTHSRSMSPPPLPHSSSSPSPTVPAEEIYINQQSAKRKMFINECLANFRDRWRGRRNNKSRKRNTILNHLAGFRQPQQQQ